MSHPSVQERLREDDKLLLFVIGTHNRGEETRVIDYEDRQEDPAGASDLPETRSPGRSDEHTERLFSAISSSIR